MIFQKTFFDRLISNFSPIWTLAAIFASLCNVALGQESGGKWTVELLRLRKHMVDERLLIESGILHGEGTERKEDSLEPNANVSGIASLNIKFDFPNQRFLCDHAGPFFNENTKKQVERRTIFCSLPEKSMHLHYSANSIFQNTFYISKPTKSLQREHCDCFFTDPRAFGIYGPAHFDADYYLEEATDEFFDLHPAFHVETEANGIVRIWSHSVLPRRRYTLWIDTTKGFTPIRRTEEWGEREAKAGDEFVFKEVISEVEITWENMDGTFVPVKYKHKANYPYQTREDPKSPTEPIKVERFVYEADFKLSWERLNEIIPETEFDYHSFDLPDKTRVYDDRTGTHVFVEQIVNTNLKQAAPVPR